MVMLASIVWCVILVCLRCALSLTMLRRLQVSLAHHRACINDRWIIYDCMMGRRRRNGSLEYWEKDIGRVHGCITNGATSRAWFCSLGHWSRLIEGYCRRSACIRAFADVGTMGSWSWKRIVYYYINTVLNSIFNIFTIHSFSAHPCPAYSPQQNQPEYQARIHISATTRQPTNTLSNFHRIFSKNGPMFPCRFLPCRRSTA